MMDIQQIVDQFTLFAQDRWYVILIAIIVLILIINIVKTVLKWVLVVIIAAGLLYYGANYTDQLSDVGGQLLDYAKEEALRVIAGEADKAQYTEHPDGTFSVETPNMKIAGKIGEDKVKITFKGQTIEVRAGDWIREYIEQARKNSQQR